jgi:hypothetical protein
VNRVKKLRNKNMEHKQQFFSSKQKNWLLGLLSLTTVFALVLAVTSSGSQMGANAGWYTQPLSTNWWQTSSQTNTISGSETADTTYVAVVSNAFSLVPGGKPASGSTAVVNVSNYNGNTGSATSKTGSVEEYGSGYGTFNVTNIAISAFGTTSLTANFNIVVEVQNYGGLTALYTCNVSSSSPKTVSPGTTGIVVLPVTSRCSAMSAPSRSTTGSTTPPTPMPTRVGADPYSEPEFYNFGW